MSVRIHQLSKKIGMENAELVELLKARGYDVKTASSTIDNISADALIEEFAKQVEPPADEGSTQEEAPVEEPVKPTLPAGAIVKTAADLERERLEREAAEKAEKEAARPKPAAAPATPSPAPMKTGNAPPPPPPLPRGKSPGTPPPIPKPSEAASTAAPNNPPPLAPPPVSKPAPVVTVPEVKSPEPVSVPRPSQPKPPPLPGVGGVKAPAPPAQESAGADAADGESAESPPKVVTLKPPIVVRDFALAIGLKPFRLISELMEQGIFASMNQALEEEVAIRVAKTHGVTLEIQHRGEGQQPKAEKKKPVVDESKFLEPRPPVICILGHVDHGKTTLLDTIRNANVVSGEAGGITQHIGAYQIEHNGQKLTFLDTPGHAAFSKMRERGANVTDVAILVLAADDGFMPQSEEALRFAKRAQVATIVAINKTDLPGANLDRVKTQMQEHGIPAEDWGGDTITVPISALKKEGIDDLLEMIHLQSEIMELKANPKARVEGVVVESQIEQGRGPVATGIVQKGSLKVGDALICGTAYCRVRAMLDDKGKQIKSAPPSTPVRIIGWNTPPEVGSTFEGRKNERTAKKEAEELEHELKLRAAERPADTGAGKPSIEDLFAAIERQEKKKFRVLLRADVAGSLEAISGSLALIKSDKIDLEIVQEDVGVITKNDVGMANAADGATIVGFNTRLENGVQGLAKHHGINIYIHNIIYELIDMVKDAMADLLEPELVEKKLGSAEVRQVFPLGKGQYVAGCMVTEGLMKREGLARLNRKGEILHDTRMGTLRRFKDDVGEVRAGYECGIRIEGFDDYEEGDIIECYEIEKIRASL